MLAQDSYRVNGSFSCQVKLPTSLLISCQQLLLNNSSLPNGCVTDDFKTDCVITVLKKKTWAESLPPSKLQANLQINFYIKHFRKSVKATLHWKIPTFKKFP